MPSTLEVQCNVVIIKLITERKEAGEKEEGTNRRGRGRTNKEHT